MFSSLNLVEKNFEMIDVDELVLDLEIKLVLKKKFICLLTYRLRLDKSPADKLGDIELVCVGVFNDEITPFSFFLFFFSYFFRREKSRNEPINDRDFRGLLNRISSSGEDIGDDVENASVVLS